MRVDSVVSELTVRGWRGSIDYHFVWLGDIKASDEDFGEMIDDGQNRSTRAFRPSFDS